MLARLWVYRVIVALLAAVYGVLLPAHHHGSDAHDSHQPHAPANLAARYAGGDEHDHDHEADHGALPDHRAHEHAAADGEPAHGEHQHPDGGDGHAGECGICHAVRSLYTPVAAPLPVLAPQAVTAALPADRDDVVSVRLRPAYHGRAPPPCL